MMQYEARPIDHVSWIGLVGRQNNQTSHEAILNTYTDVIATWGGWIISDTVTYQLVLCDDVIIYDYIIT